MPSITTARDNHGPQGPVRWRSYSLATRFRCGRDRLDRLVANHVNRDLAVGIALLWFIVHHLGASNSGIFPHAPEPTRENLTTLARFVAE